MIKFDEIPGKYNSEPPNFKKITEKEFVQNTKFFSFDPIKIEHRYILRNSDNKLKNSIDIKLYLYYDGTGVGISSDYSEGKIHYYKFSICEHSFRELSIKECNERKIAHWGRCFHVYECEKCGFIESHDSSD
jgi:hypothetical protein